MSQLIPQTKHDDRQLCLDHLQLSRRAYNRIVEQGCRTVLDVATKYHCGQLSPESIGLKSSEETANALRTLADSTDPDGSVNWSKYCQARPVVDYKLAFFARTFQMLNSPVLEEDLGILHLNKACTKLERVGITSVGLLLEAAKNGISDVKSFGKAAHKETLQSLITLSDSILEDGNVDWLRFASLRQYLVIPHDPTPQIDGELLLRHLEDVCRAVIPNQFDERAWNVFHQRFIVPDEKRPTLERIGEVYDLTRERVRQIGKECIEAISKPIFENDYRGLQFRLRDEWSELFIRARDHFQSLGISGWRSSVWRGELTNLWGIKEAVLNRHFRLVTALLGFEEKQLEHDGLESLIFDEQTDDKEQRRIVRLVGALHDLLLQNNLGLDSFGIAMALKKSDRDFQDLEEIPTLVELCSSLEKIGENQFRVRFDYLKGRGEQAYRVLAEQGMALHRAELVRQINHRLRSGGRIESELNLVNQITNDFRLEPIGKTGNWTLREWGHEARPLIEIIEEVLTNANEALNAETITSEVLKMRAGSEHSVKLLLSMNPDRFRKVGPNMFGLASWRDMASSGLYWNKEAIGDFVTKFFAERSNNKAPFKELRVAFSEMSGFGERSAQGLLAFHPAIKVEHVDHRTRVAWFQKDWTSVSSTGREGSRELQSDRICSSARRKLLMSPIGELQLIDVVRHIESELGVGRPNIYAAISQSEEIETIGVDGSVFKICRLHGHSVATFPQVEQLKNALWREECQRALKRLTVDDVDIGLFLLGRQFDQSMKQLLEAAKTSGALPVLDGHLKNLQNRIDWAISQKVFVDKATLILLKTERNERGHEPPPPEERQAILKFAPFLAGLYLDYLVMIETKIEIFNRQ